MCGRLDPTAMAVAVPFVVHALQKGSGPPRLSVLPPPQLLVPLPNLEGRKGVDHYKNLKNDQQF